MVIHDYAALYHRVQKDLGPSSSTCAQRQGLQMHDPNSFSRINCRHFERPTLGLLFPSLKHPGQDQCLLLESSGDRCPNFGGCGGWVAVCCVAN